MLVQTKSALETIRIGKTLGNLLLPGDILALVGELGVGKTQFIKGVAAGLGVENPDYLSSPSFTLINEYRGRYPFYHIDLYRLEHEREAEELGLEEYFQGEGIAAIEWADKIPSLLPQEILWIRMVYMRKHSRSIEFFGKGKRYEGLIKTISSEIGVGSLE